VYLLSFIWLSCICGIAIEALYPYWEYKTRFSLAMYLIMGWSVLICIPDLIQNLSSKALQLLVLGGVAYTTGVPFFVRNNNLDHSIWHIFVLAGSFLHWICVYYYVVPMVKSE
jgi:hemolysin III